MTRTVESDDSQPIIERVSWPGVGRVSEFTDVAAEPVVPMVAPGVIAGGLFASAGGVSANNVDRWNGTAWSAMGSGVGIALISARV